MKDPRNLVALLILLVLLTLLALGAWWWRWPAEPPAWTPTEQQILQSLWIGSLPAVPPAPSNAVADDPRAAAFGRNLFFDRRLSGNGEISCAHCHQPERNFTDALSRGRAIGEAARNTRSIVGAAYSPWYYWDGRKDSLWSQALEPLEDLREHGGTRMQYARLIAEDPDYQRDYEALFGALPDWSDRDRFPMAAAPAGDEARVSAWRGMSAADRALVSKVFANLGKVLAAYERLLVPGPARFDAYVGAVLAGDSRGQDDTLTSDEVRGLRLFIGKARCIECHNGPLFTNNEFHNTGVLASPGALPDRGRIEGVRRVKDDPFNCSGAYSDDPRRDCPELRFARTGTELLGALRTPSLRNLHQTAPFMHQGQLATLADVLEQYNRAPDAMIGHNEAEPLALSRRELAQLEAFLDTLSGPIAIPPEWLTPPSAETP
jgi:cytochrome c peroxidase